MRLRVTGPPVPITARVHSTPQLPGVYTYRADRSDEGRGYIPMRRTDQMRGEGIYLQGEPIRRRERVYTYTANQSEEGR
eukprot:9467376-Pyramimonas_sp.AAC.1